MNSLLRHLVSALVLLAVVQFGCDRDDSSAQAETGDGGGESAAADANASADKNDAEPIEPFLQAELDAMKQKFLETAPAERAKVYEEGIEALRRAGIAEKSLEVGDEAPDFELAASNGGQVKLSDVLEDGPAVLVWYRGGWCPYCRTELQAYEKVLEKIESTGATVLGIAPELPEKVKETAEQLELSYPLLSDVGNQVAERYGLVFTLPEPVQQAFEGRLDLEAYNGDDSAQLPISATYVVDTGGTIRFAVADVDYRVRAEPADVMKALQENQGEE